MKVIGITGGIGSGKNKCVKGSVLVCPILSRQSPQPDFVPERY